MKQIQILTIASILFLTSASAEVPAWRKFKKLAARQGYTMSQQDARATQKYFKEIAEYHALRLEIGSEITDWRIEYFIRKILDTTKVPFIIYYASDDKYIITFDFSVSVNSKRAIVFDSILGNGAR